MPAAAIAAGANVGLGAGTAGGIIALAAAAAVGWAGHRCRKQFAVSSSPLVAYSPKTATMFEASQEMCTLAQPASWDTVEKVSNEMQAWSPPLLCIMLSAADGSACFIQAK